MGFPGSVCSWLEQITTHTPSSTEEPDIWYGPWNAILHTLFPALERYMVSPHKRHIERDAFGTRRHSDLIMETVKVVDDYDSNLDRTVLIFEIKSSCHWAWEYGKEALIQHIGHQADAAFSELRTAGQKVYWIGAIGPHWIYGEVQDGQAPRPLIEWHDVTHDEASYRDFLNLVELVASLVEDGQA
jgi:hypothetical protein